MSVARLWPWLELELEEVSWRQQAATPPTTTLRRTSRPKHSLCSERLAFARTTEGNGCRSVSACAVGGGALVTRVWPPPPARRDLCLHCVTGNTNLTTVGHKLYHLILFSVNTPTKDFRGGPIYRLLQSTSINPTRAEQNRAHTKPSTTTTMNKQNDKPHLLSSH